MGLFKKLTDPAPGGGLTGDDPILNDSRERVTLPERTQSDAPTARIVDPTELIMGGVRADAAITQIRRASKEINLQPTFEVELVVDGQDGEFVAQVIQPVAEEFTALARVGQSISVKYDPSDTGAVWIDWAGTAAAS